MLNVLSVLIGAFALVLVIISFMPLLGWGNWLVVPLAIAGAAVGTFADRKSGRNLNLLVILIGVVRLSIGGGVL